MSAWDAKRASASMGKDLAVLAETLYLINLLLLPGIAFGILVWLYRRRYDSAPPLARCHLEQTLVASIWAGALLIGINLLILLLGGYQTSMTWVVLIIYFVVCHSTLVLLGAFGLSKAMAGKTYQFPLLGRTVHLLQRAMSSPSPR